MHTCVSCIWRKRREPSAATVDVFVYLQISLTVTLHIDCVSVMERRVLAKKVEVCKSLSRERKGNGCECTSCSHIFTASIIIVNFYRKKKLPTVEREHTTITRTLCYYCDKACKREVLQ